MSGGISAAIRWLFEDRRTGRLVVGQNPNALALLVVASHSARLAASKTNAAGPALRRLGTSGLAMWALDELLRGVNPFRQIGGAVVLTAIAVSGTGSDAHPRAEFDRTLWSHHPVSSRVRTCGFR